MESKIQPILCCVGSAVAGQPTQFLMERAFEASHCDWRVITVEVQPENFQTALDGMRVMAFTAIRFFPEFQSLAASLILEQPRPSFSSVTSALRQRGKGKQDCWDYWDNQGFGLLDLIASLAPASSTLLWLHGQSRLTQSLYDAMQVAGYSPGHLLWSEAVAGPEALGELSPVNGRPTIASLPDVQQSLNKILTEPNSCTQVVVVGESLASQLPLLSQLEVAGEIQLLLATNQLLTRQQVNDAWTSGSATIITENDQLLAAEAYDFRRWTGQQADMDLLSDAYDEYADF